jgi:hypothetical protein
MDHCGHQSAVSRVLGTVWTLGWREERFAKVDKELSEYWVQREKGRTERYGKKYGWIGFYTYAGVLDDQGLLNHERSLGVQIDPSFPEPPPKAPFNVPFWALPNPADDRRWIRNGVVTVPDELLYRSEIGPYKGPWIAVYGHLSADEQTPGRSVFGLLTGLLVAPALAKGLLNDLRTRDLPREIWLPREPRDFYTFAGEIPWSPEFSRTPAEAARTSLYLDAVKKSDGRSIEVEILAHRYAWEGYHSVLNQAGGALVPSKAFSQKFGLIGIPQSFDQALPNGRVATVSLAAPKGFTGELLYISEDVLRRYAGQRRFIWFMWGERQLYPYSHLAQDWYAEACQSGMNVWREVRKVEELSSSFAAKQRSRARKAKTRPTRN